MNKRRAGLESGEERGAWVREGQGKKGSAWVAREDRTNGGGDHR